MISTLKSICILLVLLTGISCKSNKKSSSSNNIYNNQTKGIPVIIDSSFSADNKNLRMNILNMQLNKDILTLEINYSGGCKEHSFNLYTSGKAKNNNLQLFLVDMQNEDFCKMLLTDTLQFNLSNLKSLNKGKLNLTVNRNEQILQYP